MAERCAHFVNQKTRNHIRRPFRRYRHDDFDRPVREACAARRMNNWPMHAEKALCIFCSMGRIKDSSAFRWRTERGKTNPSILPGLRLFFDAIFLTLATATMRRVALATDDDRPGKGLQSCD
ncbi:MAG: hypothetical protein WCA26_06310 [Xanthobacteraceae bacterium]